MSDTLLTMGDLEAFATHRAVVAIRAKHLAKDLGLEKQFEYFLKYNRSASLPYHGRYHSTFMMVKCHSLAESLELPRESVQAVVLAAMFHDFNHSGGVVSDTVNVGNAIAALVNFGVQEENLPKAVLDEAIDCIRVTEYPFCVEPETETQKVIRDADILQGCTVHFEKIVYVDLYQEFLTAKPDLTLIEFRKGQEAFLRGVKLFTDEGKARHEEFLSTRAPLFWRRFDKWAT